MTTLEERIEELEQLSARVGHGWADEIRGRVKELEAKVSERYERAFFGVRDEAELLRQARWHATRDAVLPTFLDRAIESAAAEVAGMPLHKQHAGTREFGLTLFAAPTQDEREHCERVANELVDADMCGTELVAIIEDATLRERAQVRAECQADNDRLRAELADLHAAENRPDVCFARGFRKGREEGREEAFADNDRLRESIVAYEANMCALNAQCTELRAELESQRSRCNHGTDLTAERDALKAEVERRRAAGEKIVASSKAHIAANARLRLEAAENKAYVERLCVEGDRLKGDLAALREAAADVCGHVLGSHECSHGEVIDRLAAVLAKLTR